jgi:hypothetical protein
MRLNTRVRKLFLGILKARTYVPFYEFIPEDISEGVFNITSNYGHVVK